MIDTQGGSTMARLRHDSDAEATAGTPASPVKTEQVRAVGRRILDAAQRGKTS